jgi:UDP-N-acetylmuramoyl-L-alanyl-D-glutamate--2,6-diaminopimelate ligase
MDNPTVSLRELLSAVPNVLERPSGDLPVAGITSDSREVKPGWLFVAVPGLTVDGHDFIPRAVEAGAVAVVGEVLREALGLPERVPYVRVGDARRALGWLHAAWYDFPSHKMILVGVTGTDGKTTTTNLLHAMLQAAGYEAGMISTVNARIGERSHDTGLHTTTPEASDVQRYLAEMAEAGATHAVLEVTSHGLAQHRLAGCDFDVAAVTNVTHEHLDYHGTFDSYLEAKASLFRRLMGSYRKPRPEGMEESPLPPAVPKVAVINADDPGSYAYLGQIPADWQVVYGLDPDEADVTARGVEYGPKGLRFSLVSPWGEVEIRSSLVGAFNVSNVLAASSAALALGVSPETVAPAVEAFRGVPGRMERIDEGQAFLAIVDFAHTPNALRRALEAAQEMAGDGGRVIAVFGSAGLRDREKRRLMGEVSARLADLTVVTAEDPRTESLDEIMAVTARALEEGGRREGVDFWRVPDRGEALLHAVELARPGDVVITCGKGHEQSMCFGTTEYPWDDREALRRALHGETLDTLPTSGAGDEPA